jgi:hypothetical protein
MDATTSALESLVMRASTIFLLALVATSGLRLQAQTSLEPPPPTASATEERKPEATRHSLPTDTFKPSEEVSEDYPVPFPVDI